MTKSWTLQLLDRHESLLNSIFKNLFLNKADASFSLSFLSLRSGLRSVLLAPLQTGMQKFLPVPLAYQPVVITLQSPSSSPLPGHVVDICHVCLWLISLWVGDLSGHGFSWQVTARRTGGGGGGGGSVCLLPITQRTFWLQNHCKAGKFPGGEEKAQALVLALEGLPQWRAYSNDLLSSYNSLATAQTSVLLNEAQMVAGERPRLPELVMKSWR